MKMSFPSLWFPEHQRTNLGDATSSQWNSWTWQVSQAVSSPSEISKWVELDASEVGAFQNSETGMPLFRTQITPYFMSLIEPTSNGPLRKLVIPSAQEADQNSFFQKDPLAEKHHAVSGRLIHRYPDRVLFLVTDFCSSYCRYCTRKHFTGQDQAFVSDQDFVAALDYMRLHPGIREVLLSGGDPLTLSNSRIHRVLKALREIDHVEIIRIGSRMPAVCPMRIDDELVGILREFKPVYMMTHFMHPKELTGEAAVALEKCVDHGIPVFNQCPILNGVNNHPAVLQALYRRLLYLRVKPYYAFSCDPSPGTDHLRISLEEFEGLQKELWGTLSGLALPHFSIDLPSGAGKVGVVPNYLESSDDQSRTYRGFDGKQGKYPNPMAGSSQPLDAENYFAEWDGLKNAKKL